MKIGLISFHSFSQPGGVKNHILGLHKEFQKMGIEAKIIAPRRHLGENYGPDVILLGTSFPVNFHGTRSDFCVNFNAPAIEKILRAEKFDILHYHNFGFPSAFQIMEKSTALNILTFHANVRGSKFLKTFPGFFYLFKKIIQWKMDGIIGVADLNLKFFKGYKGPKAVIPNGVDLLEFNPRIPKINKFRDGKINILFTGRIEERKGLIYLLQAYNLLQSSHHNLRLIIVGDGKLKEDYEQWTRENNLKNVCFEGEVEQAKLPAYFTTADIFVSPAIHGESFGIVLVEAMASGTPIVAFANLGYRKLLEGGRGGECLVPNKNFKALAGKIETLIKNKDRRQEMGKWGIEEAQKYSWPKVCRDVLAFYELCRKNKENKETFLPLSETEIILKEIDRILEKKILDKKDILGWKKDIIGWLKKKNL
ncbi:MAG: glycosyltransferase family 4 protein [bacterium]